MAYTIIEVERKTGVSSHTLRFWAKKGLFPFVQKDDNKVKYFSKSDVEWVGWINWLRKSQMDIPSIRHYIQLANQGEDTAKERRDMIARQKEILDAGGIVYQETRRWDDETGEGYATRNKEEAHDYRYFPEPDLMPIRLSEEYIQDIKNSLPELPESRKNRYVNEIGLPEYDADIITSSKYLSDFFEAATDICKNAKAVSNWIMTDIIRIAKEKGIEYNELPFSAENLSRLIMLIDKGIISSAIAKKVFNEMAESGENPEIIVKEKGLIQISDEGAIKEVVDKIIAANPQSVADYKAGKDRALGFLVGQCMKEMKGKGNPQILNKLILEYLNN